MKKILARVGCPDASPDDWDKRLERVEFVCDALQECAQDSVNPYEFAENIADMGLDPQVWSQDAATAFSELSAKPAFKQAVSSRDQMFNLR